jgi:hypothetical protein
MQPPYPCPTATWHNDVYHAIDATQPALSQAGRTVIVTGAVRLLISFRKYTQMLSDLS